MRLIDVTFQRSARDRITHILDTADNVSWSMIEGAGISGADSNGAGDNLVARILVRTNESQDIIDALQGALGADDRWRVVVLPVEAAMGPAAIDETADAAREKKKSLTASREEIYQDVAAGASINATFLALVIFSAIVATLGVNADNVAVVIGAMVIAPLLGPLLAFSFGSALGDLPLMIRAGRAALAGLSLGFLVAIAMSFLIDVNITSVELTSRADVGLDSVALALASGAAAALSIASGLSSALVGVMVAVALLPPSVAVALFFGAGETAMGLRALLLLATNVVCVNIASQAVFFWKGVRPRTWLEKRSAQRSRQINFGVWGGLLAALMLIITLAR